MHHRGVYSILNPGVGLWHPLPSPYSYTFVSPCLREHGGSVGADSFGSSHLEGMLVVQMNQTWKRQYTSLICR